MMKERERKGKVKEKERCGGNGEAQEVKSHAQDDGSTSLIPPFPPVVNAKSSHPGRGTAHAEPNDQNHTG
jgi:hypothetical protein